MASLETLLGSLSLNAAARPDHSAILAHASTSAAPSARQSRVVALLNLERYADVVALADTGSVAGLELEFAYAHYMSGRFGDAKTILLEAGAGKSDVSDGRMRGMVHLLAQLYYREEAFVEAAQTYSHLLRSSNTAQDTALAVNIDAVLAQMAFQSSDSLQACREVVALRPAYTSFETLFNQACRFIARGEMKRATAVLQEARSACDALDNLTEADKKAELYPIITQQLYLSIAMNRPQDAAVFSSAISTDDIADSVTQYAAIVNKAVAEALMFGAASNPYLLQAQIPPIDSVKHGNKPFTFQTNASMFNSFALRLTTNRQQGLKRSTNRALVASAAPSIDPLINATAVANLSTHIAGLPSPAALNVVRRLIATAPPSHQLAYNFAYIQLLFKTGRVAHAVAQMDGLVKWLLSTKSAAAMTVLSSAGFLGLVIALNARRVSSFHSIMPLVTAVARYWLDGFVGVEPPTDPTTSETSQPRSPIEHTTLPEFINYIGTVLLTSADRSDLVLSDRLFAFVASRAQSSADRLSKIGLIAAKAAVQPCPIADRDPKSRPANPTDRPTLSDSSFQSLGSLFHAAGSTVDTDDLERVGIPSSSSPAATTITIVPSSSMETPAAADLSLSFARLILSPRPRSDQIGGPAPGSKRSHKTQAAKEPTTTTTTTPANPGKRLRLSRQPKSAALGQPVDPERWLPLRDRSYFKPKGKSGKRRAGGAAGGAGSSGLTQGGGGPVDESLAAVSSVIPPAGSTPSAVPGSGPNQSRNAPKKGKKGRR